MFRLPAYQELSKEQDKVYNLPVKGCHLVIGPPGTGKTVIAIYRAEMLKRANVKAQFVVYNNTLNQYLETAITNKQINGTTSTFHRWFPDWYYQNFGTYPPKLADFVYDWRSIYQDLGRKGDFTKFPNLIIDEAQDFPKELYMVLRLLVENLTVFADENQRIWDTNSTIDEIKQALGNPSVYCLSKNYRNSRPIAEFARCFYTGLQTGIPDLPDRKGSRPQIVLASDNTQINLISNYAKNNPDKHIGVMVPYKDQLQYLYNKLENRASGPVQMYFSDDPAFRRIEFHWSGLKLVTYQSAKGLEFDTVFLPFLNKLRTDAKVDDLKMKFYVMTSRARENLYLLAYGDQLPFFLRSVPTSLYTIYKR